MGRRIAGRWWVWLLLVLSIVALGGFWILTRPDAEPAESVLELQAATPVEGFARAERVRPIVLPDDHGPHLGFQTEWWYYTGNVETAGGRHFGYQLTFFRRGLTPPTATRRSDMAAQSIYFAHLALTDVDSGQHRAWERFSRGAAGLAGADGQDFRVWVESWSAQALDADGSDIHLVANADDVGLDLTLRSRKPLVAHGDHGLSAKGDEPGNASYYVSYTRMETDGRMTTNGDAHEVLGLSWFDHEWSTSALGPNAVGWDWFSLQLSSGAEIMYFQIRDQDGSVEPVSAGTWIEPDGGSQPIAGDEIEIEVLDHWISPDTQARYPSRWRVRLPGRGLDLTVEPWLLDQEMNVSLVYWEGAVRLAGTQDGAPVDGNGYVELTGYAESMQGKF
jgi:predicted secreted hydrolase